MIPPRTLLSSPMMAFCTVFESVSRTTRSNGLSWTSSRLPESRRLITKNAYMKIGRRIFSARGSPMTNMSFQISCITGLPPRDARGDFLRAVHEILKTYLKSQVASESLDVSYATQCAVGRFARPELPRNRHRLCLRIATRQGDSCP